MADRTVTDHGAHDLELVAAYVAADLVGPERDRAAALVASCPECALLATDLRTIATASRADAAFVAAAPRDFRLTPQAAARARHPSLRERIAAAFGPSPLGRRPIGAAIATLGLAGVLLFGLPVGSFLGVTSGAREYSLSPAGQPAPAGGKAYGPGSSRTGQGAEAPAIASAVPGPSTGAIDAGGGAPSGAPAGGSAGPAAASPASSSGANADTGSNGKSSGPEAERGSGQGVPPRVALGTISIALLLGGAALVLVPSRRRPRQGR